MGQTTSVWDVLIDGLSRLEAPCLDLDGNVCFSDISGDGQIFRIDASGQLQTVGAARSHVGGLVPHVDGSFVASGHTVAVLDANGGERVVIDADGGWGFNDLCTDADGNVFVGMHTERPTIDPPAIDASLWRVGADGSVVRCYDGIQLTNGLGFSPDGASLYHNDTLRKVVWVSDMVEGRPVNRRVFHELRDGMPDGLAIDESGCVWVALIGVGKIIRLTPAGVDDFTLAVPMPYVSAVCFAGPDRRDLVVTTFGGAPYDNAHSGSVVTTRVDVAGARVTPARV